VGDFSSGVRCYGNYEINAGDFDNVVIATWRNKLEKNVVVAKGVK
jgi:predicted RNA methylase